MDILSQFTVYAGFGIYRIYGSVYKIGEDFLISVYGGTKPHIGAVAAAYPYLNINCTQKITTTSSVISFPGHKETEIALLISKTVSKSLKTNAAVTVGIHIDDIEESGIKQIIENSEILAKKIVKQIQCTSPKKIN